MDIVVTVKQVPDPDIPPTHFKVDEAAKKVIPPAGSGAGHERLRCPRARSGAGLKEQLGGKVTVVSLGPDSARDTLKRAIAMGADAAIHVNDPALNEADSTTTARALAAAIKKIGTFDLVLSGRQASDTDGGQVHLGVAEHLGVPAVSPVQKIEEAAADSLTVQRIVEDGYQRLKVRLPALLGVSSEINEPRYPPLKGIMAAGRAQIPVWTGGRPGPGRRRGQGPVAAAVRRDARGAGRADRGRLARRGGRASWPTSCAKRGSSSHARSPAGRRRVGRTTRRRRLAELVGEGHRTGRGSWVPAVDRRCSRARTSRAWPPAWANWASTRCCSPRVRRRCRHRPSGCSARPKQAAAQVQPDVILLTHGGDRSRAGRRRWRTDWTPAS